jgi:hypothetical protein
MSTEIRAMSAVEPELVKEYLTGLGEPRAVVEWKYFDERFNQGRERGFVWISDGRVRGFIGLIPFRMAHGHHDLSVAWSCDWSLDRRVHPGLAAVMLVRESLRPYDFILSCGGNEKTRRIFSQFATTTSPGAGVTLHAPIRAGCLLQLLQGTLSTPVLDKLQRLSQVPLRNIGRNTSKLQVTTEPGVSSVLAPLLDRRNMVEDCPLYDFEYVDWQIGRCPTLTSYTMYVKGVRAAVVLWCSTASRDFWRMAIIEADPSREELDSLLTSALSFVYSQGGVSLSLGASRHETNFIRNMRKHAFFVSPRRRPLYILNGNRARYTIPEPRQLNLLDTDWAYRLPVQSTTANALVGVVQA